jgi:predicted TIM-barrel fold metal-dependent hydrolase
VVIDAHLHRWDVARHWYEWLPRPENSAIRRTFGFADFAARAADRDAILDGTARVFYQLGEAG